MPLVVPGVTSKDDKQMNWMTQLMGKKITNSPTDHTSFAKNDLPKEHRVIEHGGLATQDYKKDRLNVYLGEDGTVSHVDYK